jgi:hypothetical protein
MTTDDRFRLDRRALLASLGALAGATLAPSALAGAGIVVVVHPTNTEVPSLAELGTIFTTRRQTWRNGERIVPFNFPPRDATRIAFDNAALGMDPDAVARYWIDRRIRGGNPPPRQVNSGPLIVRLVARMQGGIGYVPRSQVDGTVRVVAEV